MAKRRANYRGSNSQSETPNSRSAARRMRDNHWGNDAVLAQLAEQWFCNLLVRQRPGTTKTQGKTASGESGRRSRSHQTTGPIPMYALQARRILRRTVGLLS